MTQLTKTMNDAATAQVPTVERLPGVVIRPFRDAGDYERVATVIRESNRADDIPWLPTTDNLRTELENILIASLSAVSPSWIWCNLAVGSGRSTLTRKPWT